MLPFDQFVRDTVRRGGSINTIFEERLFALVGSLERTAVPLAAENIPHELIGGGAVMVQVQRVEPDAVRNTKDIHILIHRADLERVKDVTADKDLGAIHLIFSGEKVRPNQIVSNPPVRPEHLSIHGVQVAVCPVADLLQMKLNSNRDIDRVHVRDLDSVGLITPMVGSQLPAALRARLEEIRSTE